MPDDPLHFADLAVSRGFASREQADQALEAVRSRRDASIGAVMVELGILTQNQATALSRLQLQLGIDPSLAPDDNNLIGVKLGGCLVIERIGSGGMGTTYRAHQMRLDRDVVLKVLHPRLVKITGNLQRFEREARAAAKLDHPSIVTVYDFDQQDGFHFIIMQFVEGQNLRDVLYERGPLGAKRGAWIAQRVLEGLSHAHSQKIVHRDVKPANLMITREPRIKITDFGLVRILSMTTGEKLSTFGEVLGTPQYMAPEQAYGGDVDSRADLYSLGITLFELVTGRTPFTGASTIEVLEKQILAPIPSLRAVAPNAPAELEEFLGRLVEKDPANRFQTCDEALRALKAIKLDGKTGPVAAPVEEPARDPSRVAPAAPIVTDAALEDLKNRLSMSAELSLVAFESEEAPPPPPPKRALTRRLTPGDRDPAEDETRETILAAVERGDAEQVVPQLLESLLKRGKDDAIIALERDVENALPTNAAAEYYLGLARERKKDLEGARAKLALAVAFAPDHVPARTRLASLLAQLGLDDEARKVLEDGAVLCPRSVPIAIRLAELLYLVKKDPDAAIAAYERAVELAPDRWKLRLQLAWILYEQGRLAEAEAVLREVAEWNAEAAPAIKLLEKIRREIQRLGPEAGREPSGLVRDEGDAPSSIFVRGRVDRIRLAEAGGQHAEALALADEGLAEKPRSVPLLLARARALAALGRVESARETCERALELAPLHSAAKALLSGLLTA